MFQPLLNTKVYRNFFLIALAFFGLMFLVEKLNGRFWLNDFKVMYMATEALINGDQVYNVSFGLSTGFYKYSPFSLLFFTPFTLLSYEWASYIDFTINSICAIGAIIKLNQIIRQYLFNTKRERTFLLVLMLLSIVVHIVRELHLGNTNMILLFALISALQLSLSSKSIKAGVILAIVILTKPYFILCLLPYLLLKNLRVILSTSISILSFVIISALIIGFPKSMTLYSEWISAMVTHSSYLESSNTVFSILEQYFSSIIPNSFAIFTLVGLTVLLFAYFAFSLYKQNITIKSQSNSNSNLIIYFFIIIALVPNVLITDTEHFLFSLPLISILILYLNRQKKYLWTILFILVMFMYGGNSRDLLGKKLSGIFVDYGILGIANLIIISCCLYLYFRRKSNLIIDHTKTTTH